MRTVRTPTGRRKPRGFLPGGFLSRGFSLPALLLTLLACLGAVAAVLILVDRTTKIPPPTAPAPVLKRTLDAAARVLTRDIEAAFRGLLPPGVAIRAQSDNLVESRLFTDIFGEPTVVRPGTDILGLRGVLRTPVLSLSALDPAGILGRPAAAIVRIPGLSGSGNEAIAATAARLRARALTGPAKRFFLVKDAAGSWAVARVTAFDSPAPAACGAAAAPEGCFLELTLDFTDADAVAGNEERSPVAIRRLGPLASGGLYDEIALFVARGPAGRPPDFFAMNDPPSMANPRPYLAAAEAAGSGKWEVIRVADGVENLQVAFGYLGADGAETWVGDRPGLPLPGAGDETGAPGRPNLTAVRCALVAIGPRRPREAADDPAAALPFNAPPPAPGLSPIGWSAVPRQRVAISRESRVVEVRFPSAR